MSAVQPLRPLGANVHSARSLLGSVSALINRMNFFGGFGMTFGGARDVYEVFGYHKAPKHIDFVRKYLRQDIAQRVIRAPVNALWTDHPDLDGGARFNKAWMELVEDLDLFKVLTDADYFTGLGMFSVVFLGLDDGANPASPVNLNRSHRLLFMQPYIEASISISEVESNPTNPRFGLPTKYKITPSQSLITTTNSTLAKSTGSFDVHWHRILHLADNTLESPVFGHSRLEPIYNVLDDIQKVVGGAAETFWLTSNRGMQVDVDKDVELETEDAEALADEIDEYQHGLRRILRTRGVKVNSLGSDVADPRGVFFSLMSLLSSNTGIPQRVLMGAEAGQLASQQDRANWAIQVEQRTSLWGTPKVMKPLLRQLIMLGVLPKPSKTIEIQWAEPFKMNPLERGQTSAQQARSATNVARAMETFQKIGVDGISVEEARQMVAPSKHVIELTDKPQGTFPPKLKAPVNDPQNKLDELQLQADIAAEAAKTADETAPATATDAPPVGQ